MGWEYQLFSRYSVNRFLLKLDNEITLAGGMGPRQHELGSALAIIGYKKGKI